MIGRVSDAQKGSPILRFPYITFKKILCERKKTSESSRLCNGIDTIRVKSWMFYANGRYRKKLFSEGSFFSNLTRGSEK